MLLTEGFDGKKTTMKDFPACHGAFLPEAMIHNHQQHQPHIQS